MLKLVMLLYSLIMVSTLLIDQMTKRMIVIWCGKQVTDFFSIHCVWNKGVSFGLLASWHSTVITFLSFLIVLYLFYWCVTSKNKTEKTALALIIGGAFGNLFDRIVFGKVLDFLAFKLIIWNFPAFNFADVFISLGVMMMLYVFLFEKTGK